jgi:hypothetical protein
VPHGVVGRWLYRDIRHTRLLVDMPRTRLYPVREGGEGEGGGKERFDGGVFCWACCDCGGARGFQQNRRIGAGQWRGRDLVVLLRWRTPSETSGELG